MSFALRVFWRDWRGGELGILLGSLVMAVAIVTTLAVFADRLQRAVLQQGATFLAGDLVLSSPRPLPPEWRATADARGLRTATVTRFASMAFAGERMQLVAVKAVDAGYPLLGSLLVKDARGSAASARPHGPPPGSVWVDERLLAALGVEAGAAVEIGAAQLRIDGILVREPDSAGSLFALGPRVTMNAADLAAAGVIQPGSRVNYALLLAGEPAAVAAFRAALEPQLQPAQKFMAVDQAQPRLARSIARARSFLLLAGSLGVVLAGIALTMAARRYCERHADYVAILKTLGLRAGAVRRLYGINIALLGVAGILGGWLLAAVFESAAFAVIRPLIEVEVPRAGIAPWLVGAATGAVSLLALVVPPLAWLSAVAPIRVMRRDPLHLIAAPAMYAAAAVGFGCLLLLYSGDLRLSGVVLACVAATGVAVWGAGFALLRGARLPGIAAGSSLRLALAGLRRHAELNALQVMVFALCLMLVLLLFLVRTALFEEWQRQLPPRTPNHFLVNIAPYQLDAVRGFLQERGVANAGLYPMVPGRIVAINGEPPRVRPGEELNIDREFNLSWMDEPPADNRIVDGAWWSSPDAAEVSAEEGVARALGMQVGDRVTMQIGAERFDARLGSVRALDWDTMRPNFFLIFPPKLLAGQPATWITSFWLPPGRKDVVNSLAHAFPTVSVLEIDAVIEQLRGMTRQIARAVELVLGLLFGAGVLVMVASMRSGLDARFQESAVLRALGASRRLVLGSLVVEFALLGLLAALLAVAGAEGAAWYLQTRVMELAFAPHPSAWAIGGCAGVLGCALLGWINCRRVVDTPPLAVLRELG